MRTSLAGAVGRAHLVLDVQGLVDLNVDRDVFAGVDAAATVDACNDSVVGLGVVLGNGLEALLVEPVAAGLRGVDSDNADDEDDEPGGQQDAPVADGVAAVLDLAGEASHDRSNDGDQGEDEQAVEDELADAFTIDVAFKIADLLHELAVVELDGEVDHEAAHYKGEEGKEPDNVSRDLACTETAHIQYEF